MNRYQTIGIIGCGNMGSALVEFLQKEFGSQSLYVFDKDVIKEQNLVQKGLAHGCRSFEEIISKSYIIIIAVKPQDINEVLKAFKDIAGKLVISIVAGVSIARLESFVGSQTPVVRAMPNLNALIGQSVTALCANKAARKENLDLASEIFKAVGEVVFVKESQMNAVTAISGSGPAFVAYLIKDLNEEVLGHVMIKEAINLKIEPETAKVLAIATITGTKTNLAVNFDSQILIKRVSSKGGTTEAGMKVLEEKGKTEQALSEAIQASYKKANELAKGA